MSPRKLSSPKGAAAPASYRKPRPDFYTVLLVIALVALLIGILFLYLELNFYGMNVKAPQVVQLQNQRHVVADSFSGRRHVGPDAYYPTCRRVLNNWVLNERTLSG